MIYLNCSETLKEANIMKFSRFWALIAIAVFYLILQPVNSSFLTPEAVQYCIAFIVFLFIFLALLEFSVTVTTTPKKPPIPPAWQIASAALIVAAAGYLAYTRRR